MQSHEYLKDNALFQKKAREYTQKYAVQSKMDLKRSDIATEDKSVKRAKVEKEEEKEDSESSEASWSD